MQTATVLPFLLGRFPVSVFGSSNLLASLLTAGKISDKKLILIQLEGGNDGLNTVIPLNRYTELMNARKNILIPEKRVLRLNGVSDTGLHPSLKGIQDLYNSRTAMIIQGVGYPDQDYSHFKSADIWMSGTNRQQRETGWVGRLLDKRYPGYPEGFPNVSTPHPLAIRLGNAPPKTTMGLSGDLGVSVSASMIENHKSNEAHHEAPNSNASMGMSSSFAGTAVHSIQEINRLTEVYSPILKKASLGQKNLSNKYPLEGENLLADQLKMVARLIGGGLQTKIYILNQTGYDHHASQVESTDTTKGSHARLLKSLSEAIAAFQEDITLMGRQNEVIGMTFSEFGRRIMSNGSQGTDHGSSEPLILFGSQLKSGFIGHNPEIPKQAGRDDNLLMQCDFRSVYGSILKDWFGIPREQVNTIFAGEYQHLDLFKG